MVGPVQFEDFIGSQKVREAFLPVVVAACGFAFGLRGGAKRKGHTPGRLRVG